MTALFGFIPNVVITRRVIQTVCAGNVDPLRRVRQAKPRVLREHGLTMLCGKWPADRVLAAAAGYELGSEDWVAIPARPEHVLLPGLELFAEGSTIGSDD